jgi:hypothetical protein
MISMVVWSYLQRSFRSVWVHSTIAMTLDIYGHLFQDDGEELAAAERALLG